MKENCWSFGEMNMKCSWISLRTYMKSEQQARGTRSLAQRRASLRKRENSNPSQVTSTIGWLERTRLQNDTVHFKLYQTRSYFASLISLSCYLSSQVTYDLV